MALILDGSTGITFPNEGTNTKAWVNFNGTGTVAIRADGNVSSITDSATGQYTVNFSSSIADANYSCTVGKEIAIGPTVTWITALLTTSFACRSYRTDISNYADTAIYCTQAVR